MITASEVWESIQEARGAGAGPDEFPAMSAPRPGAVAGWRFNEALHAGGAEWRFNPALVELGVYVFGEQDHDWLLAQGVARKLARKVTGRGAQVNEATVADMSAAGHAAVIQWRHGQAMPGQDRGAAGVAWRAAVAELDRDQYGRGEGVVSLDVETSEDCVAWDGEGFTWSPARARDGAALSCPQFERVLDYLQARRRRNRPAKLNGLRDRVTADLTRGLNERSKGRRVAALGRAFRAVAAVAAGDSVAVAAGREGFKASGKRGSAADSLVDYLARVGVYRRGFQWGTEQSKIARVIESGGPVAGDVPAARESVRDLVKGAARERVKARKARKLASAARKLASAARVWVAGPAWVRPGGRGWQGWEDEPTVVRAPRGLRGATGGAAAVIQWRRPVAGVTFTPAAAGPVEMARAEYVAWWRDVLRLDLPAVWRPSDAPARLCGTLGKVREQLRVSEEFRRAVELFGRLMLLDCANVRKHGPVVAYTGGARAEYVAWWRDVLGDCGRVQAGGRAAVRAVCDAAGVWMV